ncbi:hypothetical protein NDU88_004987 [Pleurodeles waltl]|uniref:Uncharacterized protein n=1 Tax=Pleurodeles waltl TaxID=8319 RepID=A0AAV7VLH7_PLEWA|nr:hypothetical protein NDU88_004987 [Pleurodeles waltl]
MVEKGDGDQTPDVTDQTTMFTTEEACGKGADTDLPQRANKRRRAEGKPAKKTAKRLKGPERLDETPAMKEAPGSSSPHAPTESEHISTIIKECLKSFAPLLLREQGIRGAKGTPVKGKGLGNKQL